MAFSSLWPALPWLGPFFVIPRLARRTPDLAQAPRASGQLVSIVVPARNEAVTIETVVRSILASTYEPFEVLVVDDRSTDETAMIAARLAAEDRRVRLVRGADLPAGWFGKPWACLQGYREARGDLVVFTDADTRHGPALLEHAVGALHAGRIDLLTVTSQQRCVTFWERLVMPQIWLLLGLRFSPQRVNRATRPRDVVANGQFMMVTREGYEAAGTHEAVHDQVAEDVALAQMFLRRGRKLHLAYAEALIETRMYRSLGHLIEGWSKNIYLGGRQSFPDEPMLRALVPLMLMGAMVYWLLPLAMLALGLVGPGLVATLLAMGFWALISFGMEIPMLYGLGYPLGVAMVLYIAARSTWRGSRRVQWKGRVYRSMESAGQA